MQRNSQKGSSGLNRIIKFLTLSFFCIFFLISFFKIPLQNTDFWWHLATGKYILENGKLPQTDPFAYTADDDQTIRKRTILKGNWLAEVLFYKVYSLWESKGIIILRSLLLLLCLIFVYLNMRKQDAPYMLALMMVIGVYLFAREVGGERPQLFTFAVFSIVYYLLENFRLHRSKSVFLIPPLIWALSNMHPGYIVCILLITVYLVGEGIRAMHKRNIKESSLGTLFAVWAVALLFSMINPVGSTIEILLRTIKGGAHTEGIIEFMPTFSLYANKHVPVDISYIAFLLLSLLYLRYFRKADIIHAGLLTIFSYMSFTAIRYVIFYMIVAAPIIARAIVSLKEENIFAKRMDMLRKRDVLINMIAFVTGVFLVFNTVPSLARAKFSADTYFSAPKDAADFLSGIDIKGNMFNEYGFGGYLMWRLYPDKKVFIDGRALEPRIYEEYKIVADAAETPVESWHDILDKYNISYIIMPPLLHSGPMYPVVEKLFFSEEWVLIYMDHLSLIFLRDTTDNSSVIGEFALDKNEGLRTIIIQASARAMHNPVNPYYLITLGKVFYGMGKVDDSEKAFLMALERDPDNPTVKEWLRMLRENGSKGRSEGD